ncbi:MAG TPA: response regulator [Candidatus Binatus sp.]|nr:response regulator [Candidatus Binatus sp.]
MREDVPVDILVVDDDPRKLVALEAILSDICDNVVKAASGREALKCLLRHDFAVILLDLNMPGMDGFETAALIRQRSRSEHTPIIFVTAFGDETHSARGYSLGAVDYIIAPIVPEVLRTKVGVFVELFRTAEQLRRQSHVLEQRATQLHRLTQASLAINAADSPATILELVTTHARTTLQAHRVRGYIAIDEERTYRATSDSRECAALREDRNGRPAEEVPPCARLVRIPREAPEAQRQPPLLRGLLATPLSVRDRRNLGALEVQGKREGDFTAEDGDLLLQLAQMATIAIENILYAEERETNRLKDEFLATISHELRTPLGAILTWTRLLRRADLEVATLERGIDVIERNAKAQAQLVGDLLDMSRIITGKLRLELQPIDVRAVVKTALESVAPVAQAKAIEITSRVPPTAVPVIGDAERLQQILGNLLGNAIKFTPRSGRVTLALERSETKVEISVSDTGKGISPAFLPHVFDRFRQADSSTTRSHGGLGLGLAIVRKLALLHGGSVHADSPGEGLGATFTVTLSLAPQAANALGQAAAPSWVERPSVSPSDATVAPTALDGLRVLVVDDDADGREAVALVLAGAGAEVSTAASVRLALNAIDHWLPDVVVSDIAMPLEDGYVFIERLRRLMAERGLHIPAVALTAYARAEDRARALAAGYLEHLVKPVEPAHLLSVLAAVATPGRPGDVRPAAAPHSSEPSVAGSAARVLLTTDIR